MSEGARRLVVLVGVAAGVVACGGAGCPTRTSAALAPRTRVGAPSLFAMPERPRCDGDIGGATDVGVIDDARLVEVSGLAASLQSPGIVWAVADSDSTVFALDADSGARRATFRLPDLVDPEDLAVGPCPDLSGPCIFVADTGDNDRERESVAVIAFPEPTLGAPTAVPPDVTIDAVWTMRFVYPDGEKVDVEALAVLPDAQALLLFEKTTATEARIFVAPAPWTIQTPGDDDADNDRPVTLVGGGAVVLPEDGGPASDADDTDGGDRKARRITGAAMHWSGTRLVVRTTTQLVEFARPALDSSLPGASGTGSLLGGGFSDLRGQTPIRRLAAPDGEAQGEAVSFSHDGQDLLSISEVKKKRAADGERPVLRRLGCRG